MALRDIHRLCLDCNKDLWFTKYDIKRGRDKGYCQSCAVKRYHLDKPRKIVDKKVLYLRRWHQENRRKQNNFYQGYRDKLKLEMVEAYGGKCLHCSESDPIVLVIDHINDDSVEDYKKGITGGFKLYQYLKRNSWPTDRYQLLCHNCNYRKEFNRRRDNAERI